MCDSKARCYIRGPSSSSAAEEMCVSLEMECAGATFADVSKAGGEELGVCAPISGGAEGRALGFGLVASSLSTALVG